VNNKWSYTIFFLEKGGDTQFDTHWGDNLMHGRGPYSGNALVYAMAIRDAFQKSSKAERKRLKLCPDNDYDLLVLLVRLYSEVGQMSILELSHLEHDLKSPLHQQQQIFLKQFFAQMN
jgi:hypothetical protein